MSIDDIYFLVVAVAVRFKVAIEVGFVRVSQQS